MFVDSVFEYSLNLDLFSYSHHTSERADIFLKSNERNIVFAKSEKKKTKAEICEQITENYKYEQESN